MIRPKVLFLCSDNSCRTQMAEAFLRDMAGERFDVVSAGAEATTLDPEVVAAMDEIGLDISRQKPQSVALFLRERVTFLALCQRESERSAAQSRAVYAMKSGSMSRSSFRNTPK